MSIFDKLLKLDKMRDEIEELREENIRRGKIINVLVFKIREDREAIQLLSDGLSVLNQNQHVINDRMTSKIPQLPYSRKTREDDTWD